MSDTFWIVGEIIVGIAILGLLSAPITLIMTRLLAKPPAAAEVLSERYARGELTREQYLQMRQDLGIGADSAKALRHAPLDEREAGTGAGSRRST